MILRLSSPTRVRRYSGLQYVEVDVEAYYKDAEHHMDKQWKHLIWPRIRDANMSSVVEIAAGWGRNTARLLPLASRLVATDINEAAIEHMRDRFFENTLVQNDRARFEVVDGTRLPMVADGTATFVYSWDAMVHFEAKVIAAYVKEIARVLAPGGRAFLHHSNLPRCAWRVAPHAEPDACGAAGDGSIVGNPESRSVVSEAESRSVVSEGYASVTMKDLVADRAARAGLVVRQDEIPWHLVKGQPTVHDCISMLSKPVRDSRL